MPLSRKGFDRFHYEYEVDLRDLPYFGLRHDQKRHAARGRSGIHIVPSVLGSTDKIISASNYKIPATTTISL